MIEKNNYLLQNARSLRREMTPQERKLWYCFLRKYPVKIFKQRIIENYIADFYSSEAKIVIEVDGSQHYEPEKMEYDQKRSEVFHKYGLEVLRFSNRDVNEQFENVCEMIHNCICNRIGYNPYENPSNIAPPLGSPYGRAVEQSETERVPTSIEQQCRKYALLYPLSHGVRRASSPKGRAERWQNI